MVCQMEGRRLEAAEADEWVKSKIERVPERQLFYGVLVNARERERERESTEMESKEA